MPQNKEMYIVIPKEIMDIWVKKFPEIGQFINSDGKMYARLTKFLYGLPEAPHQFNKMLHEKLISIGFKVTKADKCVYTMDSEGHLWIQTTLGTASHTGPIAKIQWQV